MKQIIGYRRDGRPIYSIAGGDIEINLPSGDDGGGGDGGGGGGGGGSSAPKVDPIIARRMAAYQTVYQSIWGEPADEAYLKSAANQGLNVWEFAYQERTKPAFFGSKVYNDKADQWVSLLKSLGAG